MRSLDPRAAICCVAFFYRGTRLHGNQNKIFPRLTHYFLIGTQLAYETRPPRPFRLRTYDNRENTLNVNQCFALALFACCAAPHSMAYAAPIDFDNFNDSSTLSNELPGIAFSGGIVLTAGVGLNEFDYPPHSGSNVLLAYNGKLEIAFATPVEQFSGYFTHPETVTFSGFNPSQAMLFSFTLPGSNVGASAMTAYAFQGLAFLTIESATGTAFAMDDFDITPGAALPLPGTFSLAAMTGLLALAFHKRKVVS